MLLALIELGQAGASQLARLSGVARQNVYTVLRALTERRLVVTASGGGVTVWRPAASREEILGRLVEAEEERLDGLRSSMASAQRLLDRLGPEQPRAGLPYLRVIPTSAQTTTTYQEMVSRARRELLVFNRGPYDGYFGTPKPAVLQALARGVRARALYQAAELDDPAADSFRRESEAYHDAGAEGRVVDCLPVRLAVVDERLSILALPDPLMASGGFPTNLLVEHRGFARALRGCFEYHWQSSRPYEPLAARRTEVAVPR